MAEASVRDPHGGPQSRPDRMPICTHCSAQLLVRQSHYGTAAAKPPRALVNHQRAATKDRSIRAVRIADKRHRPVPRKHPVHISQSLAFPAALRTIRTVDRALQTINDAPLPDHQAHRGLDSFHYYYAF